MHSTIPKTLEHVATYTQTVVTYTESQVFDRELKYHGLQNTLKGACQQFYLALITGSRQSRQHPSLQQSVLL